MYKVPILSHRSHYFLVVLLNDGAQTLLSFCNHKFTGIWSFVNSPLILQLVVETGELQRTLSRERLVFPATKTVLMQSAELLELCPSMVNACAVRRLELLWVVLTELDSIHGWNQFANWGNLRCIWRYFGSVLWLKGVILNSRSKIGATEAVKWVIDWYKYFLLRRTFVLFKLMVY